MLLILSISAFTLLLAIASEATPRVPVSPPTTLFLISPNTLNAVVTPAVATPPVATPVAPPATTPAISCPAWPSPNSLAISGATTPAVVPPTVDTPAGMSAFVAAVIPDLKGTPVSVKGSASPATISWPGLSWAS